MDQIGAFSNALLIDPLLNHAVDWLDVTVDGDSFGDFDGLPGLGIVYDPADGYDRTLFSSTISFRFSEDATLRFAIREWPSDLGTHTPGSGPIVDNVSLSIDSPAPAPEPASWAMLVGGFGLIGTALRRRQRAAISFG
jgi:hypothetical protein